MPKSKKPSNTAEEKKTAWRKPVKLPTTIPAVEPMKSLYAPASSDDDAMLAGNQVENFAAKPEFPVSSNEGDVQRSNQAPEIPDLPPASVIEKPTSVSSGKRKSSAAAAAAPPLPGKQTEAENKADNLSEVEFLRLLRTEKMDFYSLAEILRGSSMALYCVLYSESLAKGENRCQIRQSELMMRARINNPATLYKQERWLTALRLINKSVRPGNHSGASYEVRPLETLPLPNHILDQFGGYLAELVQ